MRTIYNIVLPRHPPSFITVNKDIAVPSCTLVVPLYQSVVHGDFRHYDQSCEGEGESNSKEHLSPSLDMVANRDFLQKMLCLL